MRTPGYKKRTLDILTTIEHLCGLGHTVEEVADFLSISRRTLQRWRKASPAVNDALLKGQARAKVTVTKALFDLATGRAVRSETRRPVLTADGRPVYGPDGRPIEQVDRQYYPPNLGAQVFYLCNRDPERWKNVQRVELSQPTTLLPIQIVESAGPEQSMLPPGAGVGEQQDSQSEVVADYAYEVT